jgi:hypothetical protein
MGQGVWQIRRGDDVILEGDRLAAAMTGFCFRDPRASGYVRSRDGVLVRVQPGARLFLSSGPHTLALCDPKLIARVTISFEPR